MPCNIKWLGRTSYMVTWDAMQQQVKTMAHTPTIKEQIWLCEHAPVYTTGRRGLDNRRNDRLPAPLHRVDRGGETTFHGAGQIVMYPLLRLRQRQLGVRAYVYLLETSCINVLADYGIHAQRKKGFPGVWFNDGKIAAVGVRIHQGISYHGMALNMHVDAACFEAINPCGLGYPAVNMHASPPSQEQLKTCAIAWATQLQALLTDIPKNTSE